MKKLVPTPVIFLVVYLAGVIFWTPAIIYGQDSFSERELPQGVYIELTKDFYEALKGEGPSGPKIYTNDLSDKYLKEIAVSTRFLVETNLQILKQQERMVQLLHSSLEKKTK